MRKEIARQRMKDVLRVDSINSTLGDLLATHVPFRRMTVTSGHGALERVTEISEEQVFQTYFDEGSRLDQHQFMIVEGASGAGKSHFIRWIDAKLRSPERPDEVILLIRRSDNTLKGTLRQLLACDEVKHIRNREVYERLIKADQTISEQKLKVQIYYHFLGEVKNDEDMGETGKLSRSQCKGLHALLSNDLFEKRLMSIGGAIDRIYHKVVASDTAAYQDAVAQFMPDDFIVTVDFVEELRCSEADKKARKTADKLIPDDNGDTPLADLFAAYLNDKIDSVIQSCAGIEPGDLQQIFKEIRQELRRQGKRLTLLIEDITSFTGVNKALLNALMTEHTGLYKADQLCRLVSVVGTTSEYYKDFRDNCTDRITARVTIRDDAFGETEVLTLVGKYLNVMSLEEIVIKEWLKNGAREEDYPVHTSDSDAHWDSIPYQSKTLELYPFTRNAVKHLYESMGSFKTPRYILRDIIEPAVHDILTNQGGFPAFCKNVRIGLSEIVHLRIHDLVGQLPILDAQREQYRSRVRCLIGIWGNGKLESEEGRLGGLRLELFDTLGLQVFANAVYGQDKAAPSAPIQTVSRSLKQETIEEVNVPAPKEDPEQKKRKENYEKYFVTVEKWHFDNGLFSDDLVRSGVRDRINDFVFSTINWQQEGISVRTINYIKESEKNLLGFANQNRGQDQILVLLDNKEEENYQLLLAFGKWIYLGKNSWNFDGAEMAIYHVTRWLMHQHDRIVETVRGSRRIPLYLKCAMIAEVYRKILNGEYTQRTLEYMDKNAWMSPIEPMGSHAHSEDWKKLLESMYRDAIRMQEIHEVTIKYFDLIQGAGTTSSKLILNYTEFQHALQWIRSSGMCLTEEETSEKDEIPKREEIINYTRQLLTRIKKVAAAECMEAQGTAQELLRYYGFDDDAEIELEDVRTMLVDIRNLYQEAEQYGVNVAPPYSKIKAFEMNAKTLTDAIVLLQTDLSDASPLETLLHFSSDPLKNVRPFLELLRDTDRDADRIRTQKTLEKEQLKDKGGWSEHQDPRFGEQFAGFKALIEQVKEVTGC